MHRESRTLALAAAIAVATPAGAAVAGEWEVEIHGGGLLDFTPSGGQASPLPQGEAFETIVPGVPSRRVTSWYYGDGGRLLQQTYTVTCGTGAYIYPCPLELGPLDPVLSSAAIRWPFGGTVGLRLGRRVNRLLTAELDIDYSSRSPVLTNEARTGLEISRSAFEAAWSSTLSSLPGSSVTSRMSVLQGKGHRLLATAVLNVDLATGAPPKWSRRPPDRRFVTYLTFGAGIVSTSGDEASATLVGSYRFTAPTSDPGAPFAETDTVTVRASGTSGTAFVGVVGVGWKQALSPRWGLRFDVRAYMSRSRTRTTLDARPSVATGSPASAFVTHSSIGAIQFVNDSSGAWEGHESSLSGPAVVGLETFENTGIRARLVVTLGVFLRF